jgi:mono/diheme cytochrome c family protein
MEYHKIVLLHRIVVSLFLLHYIVKGYFLLSGKKETLVGYTAKTRVAEMILSVLFLVTGIYLVYAGPSLSVLMYVKIALVFASIPLAIIGFRREKKPLAILAIIFLFLAYGLAEMSKAQYAKADKAPVDTSTEAADPVAVGKTVYSSKCVACHGDKGDAGLAGAKNLRITQLTDDQQKDIIKNGKPGTGMSAFPDLTDDQLNGLVAYIKTLKQ